MYVSFRVAGFEPLMQPYGMYVQATNYLSAAGFWSFRYMKFLLDGPSRETDVSNDSFNVRVKIYLAVLLNFFKIDKRGRRMGALKVKVP